MSLHVKRIVNVQVTVDEAFQKKYVALINQFIAALTVKKNTYISAKNRHKKNDSFQQFISQKINEVTLQIEQFNHQINSIKEAAIGDQFTVNQLDGYVTVAKGDNIMSVLSPALIHANDNIVTAIKF